MRNIIILLLAVLLFIRCQVNEKKVDILDLVTYRDYLAEFEIKVPRNFEKRNIINEFEILAFSSNDSLGLLNFNVTIFREGDLSLRDVKNDFETIFESNPDEGISVFELKDIFEFENLIKESFCFYSIFKDEKVELKKINLFLFYQNCGIPIFMVFVFDRKSPEVYINGVISEIIKSYKCIIR